MAEPYLSEIKIFSFNFPPKGWAFCNGQILPISQNAALFALLGTTYGGNGTTTFALPNLQGRVPFHMGQGLALGNVGGEATVTLTQAQMPLHSHPAIASSNAASAADPGGAFWAQAGNPAYAPGANTQMAPQAVGTTGSSQPHQNMSPFLTLTYCIALQGIFPSRN